MASDNDRHDDTVLRQDEERSVNGNRCTRVCGPFQSLTHGAAKDGRLDIMNERFDQTEQTKNAFVATQHLVWEAYCSHVRKHHFALQLGDDILTRVLFWTPHSSHDTALMSRWREIMYGLLSLHRMAVDMALQDHLVDTYGTTVRPTKPPAVPATALRVALTVAHNLMPTVLQLTQSQRQATARLWLERIKFVSRVILLLSYWQQVQNEPCNVVGGLLQDGGIYRVFFGGQDGGVPTVAQTQAQAQRREYVGRRTGRRVVPGGGSSAGERQNTAMWIRLIMGELLHAYRPLYWAQEECEEAGSSDRRQLWRAWILSLVMDVTSLRFLSGGVSQDNAFSQAEWNRRRIKLLLYLLRSPAWDRATQPSVLRLAALLKRVPLLGRLIDTYLWEWLLYLKHPFVAEED